MSKLNALSVKADEPRRERNTHPILEQVSTTLILG